MIKSKKGREKIMIEYEKEEKGNKLELIKAKTRKENPLEPGDKIYLKDRTDVFAVVKFVECVEEEEEGISKKYYLKIADIPEIVIVTNLDVYAHELWQEWRIERRKE